MFDGLTVSSHLSDSSTDCTNSLRVLKFGGSSLATSDRIRAVGDIILRSSSEQRTLVVVSALQETTDRLLACAREAERCPTTVAAQLQNALLERHQFVVDELIDEEDHQTRLALRELNAEFATTVHGIQMHGRCLPEDADLMASFGERWSATIVAGYLNRSQPSTFVDARDVIVTDDQFGRAAVDFDGTRHRIRTYFAELWRWTPTVVPIVTGFIARARDGRTTTIGRNGSDYTATIIGAALRASAVEIWTDVDGVLSADPKILCGAVVLPHVSYEAARELSEAGAKVLHAAAIGPAAGEAIPILVKNTLNPAAPGTVIDDRLPTNNRAGASVTAIRDVTLLTVRAAASSGDCATSDRVSRALTRAGIRPVLGWQTSSDLATTVGVCAADAGPTVASLQSEFRSELAREGASISARSDQSVIGLIGAGRAQAWPITCAFEAERVGISALLSVPSSGSFSWVVDAADCTRATRLAHRWCVSEQAVRGVALLGVGKVGGAVIDELRARRGPWRHAGIDVRIVAIANSRRMLLAPGGIDLARWRPDLETNGRPTELRELATALGELGLPDVAVLDCTADAGVVDTYEAFVDAGLHLVTPSKHASVLPWRRYLALRVAFARQRRRWLDSATVGAGLPILSSVRDLVGGGDAIAKIEGVLSGTLGFLFTSLERGTPFSAAVGEARQLGLTEPDAREDLSGLDVARKILILARQAGLPLELEEVEVESLVACNDETMHRRVAAARAHGAVLRYVATLENGRASAAVREVPADHPLARATGCDNMVAISSARYAAAPLIICGPGAGATVTAKAVIADLAKLLHETRG